MRECLQAQNLLQREESPGARLCCSGRDKTSRMTRVVLIGRPRDQPRMRRTDCRRTTILFSYTHPALREPTLSDCTATHHHPSPGLFAALTSLMKASHARHPACTGAAMLVSVIFVTGACQAVSLDLSFMFSADLRLRLCCIDLAGQ